MFSDCRNHEGHAPPPGEHFSETNDNSVAILLTYGPARALLAGDAEVGGGAQDQRSLHETLTDTPRRDSSGNPRL